MTGQSTFFVELAETAAMLHKATNRWGPACKRACCCVLALRDAGMRHALLYMCVCVCVVRACVWVRARVCARMCVHAHVCVCGAPAKHPEHAQLPCTCLDADRVHLHPHVRAPAQVRGLKACVYRGVACARVVGVCVRRRRMCACFRRVYTEASHVRVLKACVYGGVACAHSMQCT